MPNFPYLPPSEKRGLIALAVILLVFCIVSGGMHRNYKKAQEKTGPPGSTRVDTDYIGKELSDNPDREKSKDVFTFDPNTADSATFVRLGLPYWIAKRIIRYRASGRRFHQASDLKKIYGLTDEDFERLEKYIVIDP